METTRTVQKPRVALERAVALLPHGRVERIGRIEPTPEEETEEKRKKKKRPRAPKFRLQFNKPNGEPHEVIGSAVRCLYVAVMVLTTDPKIGGFGDSMESVKKEIGFRPARFPANGLGAHEELLLRKLVVSGPAEDFESLSDDPAAMSRLARRDAKKKKRAARRALRKARVKEQAV